MNLLRAAAAALAFGLAALGGSAPAFAQAFSPGVVYDPALTRTAVELFHQRTGNCLSFAGLFVVLAREAGLDAGFQDVPVLPNWRLDGDAFVVERHVNVIVRSGREEYVVDFRPPSALANTRWR